MGGGVSWHACVTLGLAESLQLALQRACAVRRLTLTLLELSSAQRCLHALYRSTMSRLHVARHARGSWTKLPNWSKVSMTSQTCTPTVSIKDATCERARLNQIWNL